jgi:hypothetical protein
MMAMASRIMIMNAEMRMVQPKPTCSMSLFTMIGKMMPPTLEPVASIAKAMPCLVLNQALTELSAAPKLVLLTVW